MPAMTNILVKDDAATPKEWTFIPVTDTPFPTWRGSDANLSVDGQPRLSYATTKLKNGSYKVTAKLEVPVLETLGTAGTSSGYVAPQKVAHVLAGIFTMFADKRSTEQDRANLVKMMSALMQGASSASGDGLAGQGSAAGGAWLAVASSKVVPYHFIKVLTPN